MDATRPGALATAIGPYFDANYRNQRSAQARQQAVTGFSEAVVVTQILKMYQAVLTPVC